MKKSFLFVIAALVCMTAPVAAQNTITIKGKVKFSQPDFEMTVYRRDGSEKVTLATTTVDKENNYSVTLKVEKPEVLNLDCGRWQDVRFWAEDENLQIDFRGLDTARIKIKNPPYVHINGGAKNEVMNLLNYVAYRNYQMMIAISQATYRAEMEDKPRQELSMQLYGDNSVQSGEWVKYIAEHYADRTSVMAAVQQLNPEQDAELIEKTLATLEQTHPNYQPIADYRAKVAADKEAKERMAVGSPAPLFECATAEGKMVGPATFKGKVLLIDFWASWCGPCRQEIPNLKKYYEQYKDKGVEFLSVSIDSKAADWAKAVKEEDMPWTQVLAERSGKELTQLYQFSGIPFILVIDREGNIYKKFVRGEQIGETLEAAVNGVKETQTEKPKAIMSMGMM